MSCLSGCAAQYDCVGIKKPIDGYSLAPFVRMRIGGGGVNISVGNESSPPENTAVIKSFQFGTSSGAGTVLEIHDQAGGDFEKVMCKLNRKIKDASKDYRMQVKWGWVDSPCGAASGRVVSESDWYYFVPFYMDANYTEGKIKFQISGTSLMEIVFEARQDKIFENMSLKAAIKKLFQEDEPVVQQVGFLKISPSSGQVQPWDFADNPPDGPIGNWFSNNQNKLQAAMDWMTPYLTKEKKGVTPTWDPKTPGGRIIFWEDPEPKFGEAVNWCGRSLGTYIVNGGKCSPVISFNPVAKWVYGAQHENSGNVAGADSAASKPNKINEGCDFTSEGAGTQTLLPIPSDARDKVGPNQTLEKVERGTAAHDRANRRIYSMEGELRIQGDPKLAGPLKTFGRTVSLVVINPFHLRDGGGSCGNWLADPVCNPVYSNKAWWVKGIDHNIREGSYVTTVKVALSAPGSDVNSDEPFGGEGSNGWVPCST